MARPRGQTGARAGALVGAIGGLAFVLVNGSSAGTWAWPARIAAVALFVLVVALVATARRLGAGADPAPGQMRAYWWIVIAEVVAIPSGPTCWSAWPASRTRRCRGSRSCSAR